MLPIVEITTTDQEVIQGVVIIPDTEVDVVVTTSTMGTTRTEEVTTKEEETRDITEDEAGVAQGIMNHTDVIKTARVFHVSDRGGFSSSKSHHLNVLSFYVLVHFFLGYFRNIILFFFLITYVYLGSTIFLSFNLYNCGSYSLHLSGI